MSLKPGSSIFAVNSAGRVFSLSKHEGTWREFEYLGIEFKRVSAAQNVLWAIGGDHQVYVFVYGLEVPIRVKEVTYENERWNPVEGFCSKLLPTDRANYSIMDGTRAREKDSIQLPTMAWIWDDDWHVDTLFNGVQLPMGGWTYAVDFPAEYYPKKGFTSCVRRRKWLRHRKYVATNSWSAVPGLSRDIGKEPFIDVSVGGINIPGGRDDELMVWTVTMAGRVMVRQGVTNTCPEGLGWLNIPTPEGKEVSQLSVAPSGLVWAVTWQGSAIVRLGVTMIDPTGTYWCEVGQPRPEHPLSVVAVGTTIVWGVTRGGGVWFRQGVRTDGETEVLVKGTKWIQMVGGVSIISVGVSDKVMAVGDCDRPVLIRTGVTPSDIGGKTWKPVTATIGGIPYRRRLESGCSTSSGIKEPASYCNISNDRAMSSQAHIGSSLGESKSTTHCDVELRKKPASFGEEVVANTERAMIGLAIGSVTHATLGRVPFAGSALAGAVNSAVMQEVDKGISVKANGSDLKCEDGKETFLPCNSKRSDSSVAAKVTNESQQGNNDIVDLENSMYTSAAENLESCGQLVLDWDNRYNDDADWESESETVWVWVSMGGCQLDNIPQSWLVECTPSVKSLSLDEEPWRRDVLSKLSSNNKNACSESFKDYKCAIESSSWVKKCLVRINTGGRSKWEQVTVELEQCGSKEGHVEFGTLSFFGHKSATKEHLSLSELTCVSLCSEKNSQLAIHTAARSVKLQPILVKFSSEAELYDWHADLVGGMNSVHGTITRPGNYSLFSVTGRGEVLVYDPKAAQLVGEEESTMVGSQYSQEIPLNEKRTPCTEKLSNGFGVGSALYFEITIEELCEQFSLNLQCGKIGVKSNDISLHFNPRLLKNYIVLNSYDTLSSSWGHEEKQPLVVMMEKGTAMRAFTPEQSVQLVIKSEETRYEIFVNGVKFAAFKYRIRPENVTHFKIDGEVIVSKAIYSSRTAIIPPSEMYWRTLGGGHLLQVETCPYGIVWGLGYDSTPWVYTGGWGGPTLKGNSEGNLNPMYDTKYFYIYENQRWNPLTGFSSSGLPTDRPMWSDKTGHHAASKESVRLPSGGWMWLGDWVVDHHTPGGTDKDGWQYAKDFPASYHAASTFTDYVRRRRWARRCKLSTNGPWTELGTTKLLDLSLQPYQTSEGLDARCWAVATNGEALYRIGVTRETPCGVGWSHIRSDTLFQGVTVGTDGSVWLVSSEGQIYLRQGVTDSCPSGQLWVQLNNPDQTIKFRSVEAGRSGLWAVDTGGKLWLRKGISIQYPEGTSWMMVCSSVRSISCGDAGDLWAVVDDINGVSGVIARRGGITPCNPGGEDWEVGIGGGWKHLSVRGWVK